MVRKIFTKFSVNKVLGKKKFFRNNFDKKIFDKKKFKTEKDFHFLLKIFDKFSELIFLRETPHIFSEYSYKNK